MHYGRRGACDAIYGGEEFDHTRLGELPRCLIGQLQTDHIRRSTLILRSHVNSVVIIYKFAPLQHSAGFMSSVDLHTHSGFQRMLPESFAVVCAPKSTPK